MSTAATQTNNALMRLSKRAESQDKSKLVQTFVDVGTLFTLLSRLDHQIIYGRRGTGKTHAITYLAEKRRETGDCVVYLDLRTVGSTGGIFGDTLIPLSERATRLLADTLPAFHGGMMDCYVDLINTAKAPQGLLPLDNKPGELQFTDVPPDDYRAIRRAILDLSEFEKTHK
jgi:hypothetical protein